MELEQAKDKFIQTWGVLATQWGISRTMAQVHALLMISKKALSTEQVMDELNISRGNANMNLRALMEWGIVEKELISGERKDFYSAKKDVWELFKQITKERKKREIDPVLKVLNDLQNVEGNDEDTTEFKQVVGDLENVTEKVYGVLDKMIRSDEHWLLGKFTDLMK